jgi:cell division transport system permease protein
MAKFKQRKPKSLIKNYFASHGFAIALSFKKLWSSKFSALMTIFVIAGALTILASFYLLLANVQYLANNWQDSEAKISIYLKPNLDSTAIQRIEQELTANPNIRRIHYISPAEGLKEFASTLGNDKVITSLPSNPLPGMIVADPILNFQNPESMHNLTATLQKIPNVDVVQLDTVWVQRLHSIVAITTRISHGITGLLALGILLIIWNTIKFATQKEKEEIAVLQYIGATNNFIRRPFIYLGAWYGLLSGILTCVFVILIMYWVAIPLGILLHSYGSSFSLIGLDIADGLKLLLGSIVLSSCGAWLAVTMHLHSSKGLNHE